VDRPLLDDTGDVLVLAAAVLVRLDATETLELIVSVGSLLSLPFLLKHPSKPKSRQSFDKVVNISGPSIAASTAKSLDTAVRSSNSAFLSQQLNVFVPSGRKSNP
jgi:hypothetical protein